jgi:hypothetical protein
MTDINPGQFRVNRFVMSCGHISTGLKTDTDGTKIPVCIDCIRSNPKDATTIADISNRVAHCRYCGKATVSDPELFAFSYQPEKKTDQYYCGCRL